jgi:3-hexulose-6-phosphate synthase
MELPAFASRPNASQRLLALMRSGLTFQISVDTARLAQGLAVAEAAVAGGVSLIEMGTPLLKNEGVINVVPAFRRRFPDAVLLADMKTMDGGGFEARAVYEGGGNIIDFLASAGVATAKGVCAVRDEFRERDIDMPRLAFADILLPHQGPAGEAIEIAHRMLDAGVDGVGVHLQADARAVDPDLYRSDYLADVAMAVFDAVGDRASVQVVGGLSVEKAQGLARRGLKAFVISGNFGHADGRGRYDAPAEAIEGDIRAFIAAVAGR